MTKRPHRTEYDKLVRDRIPEIILESGATPVTHIASSEEYRRKLVEKLYEEIDEFCEDPSAAEMVDILEVIYAICELYGHDIDRLETLRLMKRAQRGGLEKRIILEEVEE